MKIKIQLRRLIVIFWRKLTSMQLALMLLFLLAIAAIPGAFLPQHQLNESKTQKYILDHGKLGQVMDKLQLFSVFTSSWFSAIYLLLCISLIGCILPRIVSQYQLWKAPLPKAPRNLFRLPYYCQISLAMEPEALCSAINTRLKRWRKRINITDNFYDISAEKGFLREIGNLIFHISLVGLLVCIAIGKFYSYEGIRIVTAENDEVFCTSTPAAFDSFKAGRMIDGTDLIPLCVRVDNFQAHYLPNGQADAFLAQIHFTDSDFVWKKYILQVNHPLRFHGSRVYLLGHGFSPSITITFPQGQKRTLTVPFRPIDPTFFLSEGAMRFDPPAGTYHSEREQRAHQIGIEGLFAPTAQWEDKLLTSRYPAPAAPELAIDIYQGDTGLNSGLANNPYILDRRLMHSGRLQKIQRVNLVPQQSLSLPNGLKVTFSGYKQWIAVQVSHDPAQNWVLLFSLCIVAGLTLSLTVKHRRIWFRIPRHGSNTHEIVVECAGLAKTDQAGWGDNFEHIVMSYFPQNLSRCS